MTRKRIKDEGRVGFSAQVLLLFLSQLSFDRQKITYSEYFLNYNKDEFLMMLAEYPRGKRTGAC